MKPILLPILLAVAIATPTVFSEEKPNFIVIFCDDLGYNDIGPFGSKLHRTPHLDRMAAEGRVFTSFYSTSGVCSPSRSSLMTGCYPKRIGLHQNETGAWVLFPGNKTGLNPSEITVAEVLKEKGYATACVGKWHLGDQPEFLPTKQGFDSYFGIPFSNDMGELDRPKGKYPPLPLLRNETVIEEEPDQRLITQRYTEEALQFIEENHEEPFFLYLPHTMPHWPQYSSARFEGRSANGAWGDTVEEIDWSTGQILDKLEQLGIDERTLVLFTSDNGGATRHGASNFPLAGAKGSTMEGGQRVCMVARWPGKIPAGTKCDAVTSTMDILPTFASLAGTGVPTDRTIDGFDISSLLQGEASAESPYEAFYYYFRGNLEAVRVGPWKLHLRKPPRQKNKGGSTPIQLFHLGKDIGESVNVSEDHPEIVQKLEEWAEKARQDLGDDAKGMDGHDVRPPGLVDQATPLTRAHPQSPAGTSQ